MRLRRRVTGALAWGLGLVAVLAWSAAALGEVSFGDFGGAWQIYAWLGVSSVLLLALVSLRPSWWAPSPAHRAAAPWLLAGASPALFVVSFGQLAAVSITGERSGEAGEIDPIFKLLALLWVAVGAGLAWRERHRLEGGRWASPRSVVSGVVAGAATVGLSALVLAAFVRMPTRRESYVASLPVVASLPFCSPPHDDDRDEPALSHSAKLRVLESTLTLEQHRSRGGCTVDVLPEGNGALRRRLGASGAGEQVVRLDEREGMLVMATPGRVFAFDIVRRASVALALPRVASQLRAPSGWLVAASAALVVVLGLRLARRRAARALELLSYGAQARAEGGWLRFDDGRDDRVIPDGITVRPGRVVVLTWSHGRADAYRGGTRGGGDIDVFPGSLDRLLRKASANVAALDGFTVAVASLGGAPLATAAMMGLV